MKQAHCIYQQDDHRWLAIARDTTKPGYIIDTNEYVVVSGDEALLCDPGGIEIFPAVFSANTAAALGRSGPVAPIPTTPSSTRSVPLQTLSTKRPPERRNACRAAA